MHIAQAPSISLSSVSEKPFKDSKGTLSPERGLEGLAGALLGAWLTGCVALQIPQTIALGIIATLGIGLCRLARVWGLGISCCLLAYLLVDHPTWLAQDLWTRGSMLIGLINIWMLIALRSSSEVPETAPRLEGGLQDVERSLMPHSAQVKRDLDQAQLELSRQRQQITQVSQALEEQRAQQAALQQANQELIQQLQEAQQAQKALEEQLIPVRLEAGELREVLSRTMVRTQTLEAENSLLDDLKQSLRKAQESVQDQQDSLSAQGQQLQEALSRLLEEQRQRAELEASVLAEQEQVSRLQRDLIASQQDLERQERVADDLLRKCLELELHNQEVLRTREQLQQAQETSAAQRRDQRFRQQWQVVRLSRLAIHSLDSWGGFFLDYQQSWASLQQDLQKAQEALQEAVQGAVQEAIQRQEAQLEQARQQLLQTEAERTALVEAYGELHQQLVNAQQVLQEKECALEELQRQWKQAEQSWQQTLQQTVEQSLSQAQDGEEQKRALEAEAAQQRLMELQEALASAQAQAQHASSRLEQTTEQLERLRQQLADPQRQEAQKRSSMLERQLAVKEQVIARLQSQTEELPELLRMKHQHQQLREQFEEQKRGAEALHLQCRDLEAQVLALREQTDELEPGLEQRRLFIHLQETETERESWEQEAMLATAALKQLLQAQR